MIMEEKKQLISIVVPVYNEEGNISLLAGAIVDQWSAVLSCDWLAQDSALKDIYDVEVIFVDDGSSDDSLQHIKRIAQENSLPWLTIRYIEFSRNFGKEIATTAGIHDARGDACLMLDADLQHPIGALPSFIEKWREGNEVVIGVRRDSKSDSVIKRLGGAFFYRIMGLISTVPIVPQATDYRLLDRTVVDAFNELPERNRITRGLIDWLGFRRVLVHFDAAERQEGEAGYSIMKLANLAVTSVISMSLFPLKLAAYLGIIIVTISFPLGLFMFIDRYVMQWGFDFTGSAILAVIVLFMIGIVLICIGLLAFYVGHIYHESQGRQLYVVRSKK